MNPNQIFEDFERKYQGSYVQLVMGKSTGIFKFCSMRSLGRKFPEIELQSDIFGTVVLNYNTQAKILFKIPKTGYIQHKKEALYFTRRPERQWKRGIHANNCEFNNPKDQYRLRVNTNNQPCFDKIREAFNPRYYTLKEALDLLQNKKYESVALSRNMAISLGKPDNDYILWYRYGAVGLVDCKSGHINAPGFDREVQREIK